MTPLPPPVRSYEALAARIRASGRRSVSLRVIGHQTAPDGGPSGAPAYELYLARIPARERPRLRVYLNGGTHGDEYEGPLALFELARTLLPLPKKVRLLGVTVSNFEGDQDAGGTQMAFDFEDDDPLPA